MALLFVANKFLRSFYMLSKLIELGVGHGSISADPIHK